MDQTRLEEPEFDGLLDGETPKEEELVYTLNEGQQEAHTWLVDFCLGKNQYVKALLEGYAGTGKTFIINRIVETVKKIKPGVSFGMTAPTHKAVRQLKKACDPKLKSSLEFGTIHSFLSLKQVIDNNGKVSYKPDFNPNQSRKIDMISVLILDEVSMLDDMLYGYIEDEVRGGRLRVIFMGDSLQIPPVGKKQATGDSFSIPFIPERQISHKIFKLLLTEPQRQAKESPILMYANNIREHHLSLNIPWVFREEDKHALEEIRLNGNGGNNLAMIRELFREYFCTEAFDKDPDYAKVISYRNDTVRYFNKQIRLMIHGVDEIPKIVLGDKLVMDAPFVVKKTIVLANNEDVVVKAVKVIDMPISYRYRAPTSAFDQLADGDPEKERRIFNAKVYQTIVQNEDGFKYPLNIIHEDSEIEYNQIRESLKLSATRSSDQFVRKDMWKEFYAIEEKFQWVNHNYCLTAHKSQGSTYQFAFSMEWDMNVNRDVEERNRIKYVAATRPKQKLFVITK